MTIRQCYENKCTWVRSNVGMYDAGPVIGAPFHVILHDAVEEKSCSVCGAHKSYIIPDVEDLVAVSAVMRAANPVKLNRYDIQFLRKSLNERAKDFALAIAVTPETLSRYENGSRTIADGPEHQVRSQVFLGHFETTHELGLGSAEIRHAISIKSVRTVEDEVEIHLGFGIREDRKNNNPVKQDTPIWLRAS